MSIKVGVGFFSKQPMLLMHLKSCNMYYISLRFTQFTVKIICINRFNKWLLDVIDLSSSCRTASTDLPDPLSPPVSILFRPQEVFQATSCISEEWLYIGSSWTSYLCSSMWKGPWEHITYEFILTSPPVSHMPGSSNLDSFHDGW